MALRFQGYGYQHHHVPDWQPPAGWPWKETAVGHNGKGVDCSNFSSFVYNIGFGIKPTSAIKEQAERREMPGPGEGRTTAQHIELPKAYDDLVKTLRTGDLVFIKGSDKGHVTHVVLWVGAIGFGKQGAAGDRQPRSGREGRQGRAHPRRRQPPAFPRQIVVFPQSQPRAARVSG